MGKNSSALRWIYENSKFALFPLIILVILSGVYSFCTVGFALAAREVIDVATGQKAGVLSERVLVLFGLVIFQLLLQVLSANINVRVSGRLEISFRRKIFSSLFYKDWQSVSSYHSGDLMNRITGDIAVITGGISDILPDLVMFATRVIVAFGALYALDYVFALIILSVCPFILIGSRIYSKRIKGLHKKYQESEGRTRSFMQEALQNLMVIKSFGNEDAIVEKSDELQLNTYKFKLRRNTISILVNISLFLVFTAGYYLTLAWGAYKLARGAITYGTLIAMLQLVAQVQTPFRGMSALYVKYQTALASAERLIELENIAEEEGPEPFSDPLRVYDSMNEIVIDNVSFSYQNKDEVLSGASLRIKKGEFVAIAGVSGIGKSTLLKLLLGLVRPCSGEIYINLKDGRVPVGKRTRSLFAYVPQGNMILSGTIRDNINFSKKEVDDESIRRCAETAQIWDFISSLPEGLDTHIGEKGLGLSEGQIQRIAIARALLTGAPILLLDEATSALDEATEAALLDALKSLKTVSCIIVSHKKAAIEICDKTVCIENGKLLLR